MANIDDESAGEASQPQPTRASKKKPAPPLFTGYEHIPLLTRFLKSGGLIWSLPKKHRRERPACYFIDEAGDPILFNRKKQLIVGTEGCSNFFILGMAWVIDPSLLETELEQLRRDILADSYFRRVPSVGAKTSLMFHAKDDIPEIRREVFRLIMAHPIQFFAVVRDKHCLAHQVRRRNAHDSTYRYTQNELYDGLVTDLMMGRLHRDQSYTVSFSRRGRSDRTEALRAAIGNAKSRFQVRWGIDSSAPVKVVEATPGDCACLQVTDYMLWALQRLYERNEDRYMAYVWPAVRLVLDQDDIRNRVYGEFYRQGATVLDCLALERRSRRI